MCIIAADGCLGVGERDGNLALLAASTIHYVSRVVVCVLSVLVIANNFTCNLTRGTTRSCCHRSMLRALAGVVWVKGIFG